MMKDGKLLTLEDITPEMIKEVYTGKQGCMCGCKGRYYVNPAHREQADKDRGYSMPSGPGHMKMVKKVLNILKKDGRAAIEDNYICVDGLDLDAGERNYVAYINVPS